MSEENIRLRSGTVLNDHVTRPRYSINSVSDIVNFNQNDKCAICLEKLCTDNCYTISECDHTFHTKCLLTWWRKEHRCPLCRDTGNINQNNEPRWQSPAVREGRIRIIRQICKRKDAPANLKKIMSKRDNWKNKLKQERKELSNIQKYTGMVHYKEHSSKIRKLRNRIWEYLKKIREIDGELSVFKLTEIIIRKS